MYKMISIEGVDCSGKTSVAKALSKKLGYNFIEKPMLNFFDLDRKKYSDIKAEMKKRIFNNFHKEDAQDIMFWYQAFNNIIASKIALSKNVTVDRHYITNAFWNCRDDINIRENIELLESLIKYCGKPSLTVILKVSKDSAEKRLFKRCIEKYGSISAGYGKKEYEREHVKVLQADMFPDFAVNLCKKLDLRHVLIDTEGKTISEEVDEIIDNLKNI